MPATPVICFGQQPCGFFPRRFLRAKIRAARRLRSEIGGEIVYFCHDSDHDPRETQTFLRHRKTNEPVRLNFAFKNRIRRKFSPLHLKAVAAGWQAKTALQLPNYVAHPLIEVFKNISAATVAGFCLATYRAMGLLNNVRVVGFGLLAVAIVATQTPAFGDDPLEAGFKSPPASAKPQTWWHWMNGNVTQEGITADLQAMKDIGLGGAQIFNVDPGIPAGTVKFNSLEWHELFRFAVTEANRLGLQLGIHNCAGWSSSGGPWNTPENAMQQVVTSEALVKGPARFDEVLPPPPARLGSYRDIAVLAFKAPKEGGTLIKNIDAKDGLNGEGVSSSSATDARGGGAIPLNGIVDLTGHLDGGGQLQWKVPRGNWIILRVGYAPSGRENHPAPAEGTGLECDKFSREALDAHWAGFVQKVVEDAGPLAGKTLNNVLIDSYEVGGQNWDAGFRAQFAKLRGYDPARYLPTFTRRPVGSPEISERFLWDVRRTIADLFAENYYGHFAELCHQHGLLAAFEPYTGPFESLQSGQAADLVMGEFWAGSQGDPSVKLAASIGHIYGKQIVGAESFTTGPDAQHGRWLDTPYSLKTLGDLEYCTGLNRYTFHRYAMQPWTNYWPGMTMGPWGFHFERTQTWWKQGKAWIEYLSRCQFLLQQGRYVADAAYFCGESAPVEMRDCHPPLPPGYEYDAINAGVLLHRAQVQDGRLILPDGMSYTVLVLPPDDANMTPQLLGRISDFVHLGLTVVGVRPRHSPSLQNYPKCDRQVKALAARLWGKCDGRKVTENSVGRGRVIWGKPMADVLAARGLKPDFDFSGNSEDSNLVYCHRVAGGTDIYFVSNQRRRFDSAQCTFRVSGRLPELWHPDTGFIEPAPVWNEQDGRTTVQLQFDPAGSVFVVFREKAHGDHIVAVQHDEPPLAADRTKPAQLRVLKAIYGALPAWLDVTATVKSLVSGGSRQIPANNDMAGDDPAPGAVKCLRVEFLLDGQRQTVEANEGRTLELPVGSEVVKALYGHFPDSHPHWFDVTVKVKLLMAGGAREISVGNYLADDDPAPNMVKQLRITFRLNHRERTAEAQEGDSLDVPAGAEVEKALYGRDPVPETAPVMSVDVTATLAALVKYDRLSVAVGNGLAGVDPAPNVSKCLTVEYSLDGVVKYATNHEGDMLTLPEAVTSIGLPPEFDLAIGPDGQARVQTRVPGAFTFTWASGRKSGAQCHSVLAPVEMSDDWRLTFPPGWGAPPEVHLPRLISWTDHTNDGVRYFSGTATCQKEIEIPDEMFGSGRELWLDLGTVKDFAEVTLNGQPLGTFWKDPFRVNVTGVAHAGTNQLEVKVTNRWPNRLIGDEQLPDDREWRGRQLKAWPEWVLDGKPSPTGRFTFTTWHHWTKGDTPLKSGLIGPVTLNAVEMIAVK